MMMVLDTADEILDLIKRGKRTDAEWFKEGGAPEKIAAVLGAMANTDGGTLLIGVGPTGHVEGVTDAEKEIDRVLDVALERIEPPLMIPMPKAVTVSGANVVSVRVPPGMPNVYGMGGRYLCRRETRNAGLKPAELRRLLIERGVTSFEAEVALEATLDDIDWDKARAYARKLSSTGEQDVQKILLRRGCLSRFDGEVKPTNAGILLFGKDPQQFIRGSEITAARFAGDAMGDTFSREDITGTIPEQIRRAETFLTDHLRKGVKLGKSMERVEKPEYPMEAARELVVNAAAHRDYSINGDGIRLFLFRDHMEVTSPGGLAGPVTVANIKEERFSRNPVIVQVLSDMKFIERLGYGVDRVYDLMHEQDLPAPEFTETDGGFKVMLYRQPDDEPDATPTPTVAQLKAQDVSLNPRQQIAIEYLTEQDNPRITNSELQELCPDVHPETIRRDLASLVRKQVLEKKGQKRGSYYVLRQPNSTR